MSTPAAPRAYTPRDPETFFKAQKRNRGATWRMSVLTVFAALVMGIPLTLVLTPLLYAVTLFTAEVINRFITPLPAEFWANLNDLSRFGIKVANVVLQQRGTLDPQEIVTALILFLAPGMALALAMWAGMVLLFRHGGVGGTLASMKAREPNQSDLRELQLADVVQEMAIAAGLPAPKVMLIDSDGANAAAVGTSPADASIVISRRLLDDLDRDQLQALLAHLISSVGNGDLSIAFKVTSVFETCGLILTVINAPFGKQSRTAIFRLIRYALTGGSSLKKAADTEEVAELLSDTLDNSNSDIDRFFNQQNPGLIRKALRVLLFPFMFTNIAVEITLWFFLNVLLGPCMAMLWRTRRYLADAGAIELTRNPDALAQALQRLSQANCGIEGGAWASHLFVINPAGDHSLRGDGISKEQYQKAFAAWRTAGNPDAASGNMTASGKTEIAPADMAKLRMEIMSSFMAAAKGDTQASARVQAFAQAMGGAREFGLTALPDPKDLMLARQGDAAAISRLRALRQQSQEHGDIRKGKAGLQTHSFLSFHPPLDKREKRLERMGSHLIAPRKHWGPVMTVVMVLLYCVGIPAFAFLGAMMLFVIALMIMFNLVFLTVWLMAIHWAFGQDWGANIQGFIKIVNEIQRAFANRR